MNADTPPHSTDGIYAPSEQQARQACASLAGHLYQAVRAASNWIQLSENERLLIEVAEDFAILVSGALSMTQVKHQTGATVTLRNDGVRKSLAALLSFQDANSGISVRLNYLTTADIGTEVGAELPDGVGGIAYWHQAARGADAEPLRRLLIDTQTDERVLDFLRQADAATLRARLIERVSWLTGSDPLDRSTRSLEARLESLALDRTGFAEDGARAVPFVIHRLLTTAASDQRELSRADFEQVWAQATTLPVSFAFMRHATAAMAGGAVSNIAMPTAAPLPALSPRLARRSSLVDELLGKLQGSDVLWIHGSKNLGKSQLARLISARGNERWEFVSLKDASDSEGAARIRDAISRIRHDDFAGLILDDVPVPASESLRHWIAAAAQDIASTARAKIIVTAERQPLAQIRQALDPLRISVHEAPYLLQEDVTDIVSASGGVAAAWPLLIYVTCGSGHPLLVDARVAGLASRGWPEGDQLRGFVVGTDPDELADVRQEVSLRLLEELSFDAHTLLLRLSGVIGPFDRSLMHTVAAIAPAIQRAGALFDLLLGPWIELKGEDRYSLSPLLIAAARSLDPNERNAIHRSAVENLVARQPFPADLFTALLIHSMLVRDTAGFWFITRAVLGNPDRQFLAAYLTPLMFMKADETGYLVPENRALSIMLRTAQLAVACASPDARMVEPIYREARAETAAMPEPVGSANRFMLSCLVLGKERLDLAPNFWMPILRDFRALTLDGTIPDELSAPMNETDLGGLRVDQFFFMARSNRIRTIVKLVELFAELAAVDPLWRSELLRAGPVLLGGPPLFVQSAWSSEALAKTLDAEWAAGIYQQLADLAAGWGETDIAVECVRSRAVMLDEYLQKREEALTALDEGEARFPNHERLRRSRATVLGNMGRHSEELEILTALGESYSADEPLERVMMLRSAAISAGKIGKFREAAKLFQQAFDLTQEEDPLTLGQGVPAGLLADVAAMKIAAGDPDDALATLRDAVRLLDALGGDEGDDEDTSLAFARAAVEHVIQWACSRIEGRSFQSDLSTNPGVCSTLRPNLTERDKQRKPLQAWYLLARLECLIGTSTEVESELESLESKADVCVQLAAGVTQTQVSAAVSRLDVERLFSLLPRYCWLVRALALMTANPDTFESQRNDRPVAPPGEWDGLQLQAARSAVSGLIGHLMLTGARGEAIDISVRAVAVSPSLNGLIPDEAVPLGSGADWFERGLVALRVALDNGQLNAEQLFSASIDILVWIRSSGHWGLGRLAHELLARRWQDLVRDRPALLSAPRLVIPAIQEAIELPPSLQSLARLIEASRAGSRVQLPDEISAMVRAVAMELQIDPS